MNRPKTKQRGITLIALVISIIVMLILAGVSLNLTIGENGVVTQAKNAKLAHEDAEWNEQAEMIMASALADKDKIEALTDEQKALAGNDTVKIEAFKIENMRQYLLAKFQENSKNQVIVGASGSGYIIVDGERVYTVDTEFAQGINVKAQKMLVATNEQWLFTPNGDGTCTLNSSTKALEGTIVIPAFLVDKESQNAYRVSGIGASAFNYASLVEKIDFSQTGQNITTIGARAFAFCSNLEITVPDDLPSSVVSIGDNAFYGCTKLEGNINTIQSQGYTLGKGVFMKCPKLSGSIQDVFNQNFYIIDAANNQFSATEIGESEFNGYSGLTGNLVIPYYITKIGDYAFYGCSSITGLSFATGENGEAIRCTEIGQYSFAQTTGMNSTVVLPNSITKIGNYCFSYSGITGLTLPTGLTTMGTYAFEYTTLLTGTVTIPYTLSKVSNFAFLGSNVPDVSFVVANGNGCSVIGEGAFKSSKIKTITFPNTLTTIKKEAFWGSTIGNISFTNSIVTLESDCFCWSSVNVIQWSNKLEKISGGAFYSCSKMTILPDRTALTFIGGNAFFNCTNLGVTETDIFEWLEGSKITAIGGSVFYGCQKLIGDYVSTVNTCNNTYTLSLSEGMFTKTGVEKTGYITNWGTAIADNAFKGCTKLVDRTTNASNTTPLTALIIPEGVTSIGDNAFYGCTSITSVSLPTSLISLGAACFYSCSSLTTVTFASGIKITEIPKNCFKEDKALNNFTLPNGITLIDDYAFSHTGTYSLTLPSSVKTLGMEAFRESNANVTLNEGLLSIGYKALDHVVNSTIVVPDSVTSMGKACFTRNSNLKTLKIGSGVTELPDTMVGSADATFNKLQSFEATGKITTIGDNAFIGESNLSSFKMDWSIVTSIGQNAFKNCSKLSGNITIPRACTLYENSFENCGFTVVKK